MFALVKFTDGSHDIYPMKNVKLQNEKTCIVSYKGCKYEAQLVTSNETREHLETLKESTDPTTLSADIISNQPSCDIPRRTKKEEQPSCKKRRITKTGKLPLATNIEEQTSHEKPRITKSEKISLNSKKKKQPSYAKPKVTKLQLATDKEKQTYEKPRIIKIEKVHLNPKNDIQPSYEKLRITKIEKLPLATDKKEQTAHEKPEIMKIEKFPRLVREEQQQSFTPSEAKLSVPNSDNLDLTKVIEEHSFIFENTINGNNICDIIESNISDINGSINKETAGTINEETDGTIIEETDGTIIEETDETTGTIDNENKISDLNITRTLEANLSQSLITGLEQSDLLSFNINSSQNMFQSFLDDANNLFPPPQLLTSTPENLNRDENANIVKDNKSTTTEEQLYSADSGVKRHCQTRGKLLIPRKRDISDSDGNESKDHDYDDSDYIPEDSASDIESAANQTKNSERRSLPNTSNNVTNEYNISTAEMIPSSNRCDDEDLHVEKSRGRNGDMKPNFCFYCHTKQQKIARHLEMRHKNEPDVKKFVGLPKNSIERRKVISVIRKKGNFLFNTQTEHNDGELIVSRRPNKKYLRTAKDFRACSNCKAFFSRASLRMHFAKCTGQSSKKTRIVMVMSKQVMARMHSRASQVTLNNIFPKLREDDVVRAIRYDELVIIYSNKMGVKYSNSRDYEMIRQRIRLLGRFLLRMRELNDDVTDLTSIFDPKFCDDTVKAITIEAKLMPNTNETPTPAVASTLGTLLKLIGSILINECIKKHDDTKKKHTKDYLKLLTQELTLSLNRRVTESQTLQKRRKKIELPSMEDIKILCTYLEQERNAAFQELSEHFSPQAWIKLAETTLISVQLFNRRRAGEIERTLIEDFKTHQSLEMNSDKKLFNSLSAESQALAKKYVRFVIRGKLNRTVPVLLNTQLLQCIELLLSHRRDMKISKKNPYVFGLPREIESGSKHLRACVLMRKFSTLSGAKHPERLRGTKLRKHIATVCVSLNLSEHQVTDLANYMGHAEKIHKDIYRQPVMDREILGMSKLLEAAQGANDEMDDENDTDEDEQLESDDEGVDDAENSERNDIETTINNNVSGIRRTFKNQKIGSSTKKIRFSSPYGVRRTPWSHSEKETVLQLFGENLRQKRLPSLKAIHQAITENPCLQNRTSPQIKTWLHNQTRPKIKKALVDDDV